MAATFPQFGHLPWELRDQIWNLVVRPACPGVHIFRLCNHEEVGDLEKTRHMVLGEDHAHVAHQLIIPDSDESDISTYLIDGGLWTACKESRRVMERRFRPNQKSEHRQLRLEEDASATGYFIGHHGVPHYFTVLPHHDLFLFQVQDLAMINWDQVEAQIPLGSPVQGYEGRLNIAIEYRQEWGIQLGKAFPDHEDLDIVQTLIRMSFESTASYTIWLVDDNLRRKPEIPGSRREEPMGFSARDQRLVPVEPEQEEQWEYIKEVEVEEKKPYSYMRSQSDSMAFVRLVGLAAQDDWDSYETFDSGPCPIGLLAWDSL